MDWTRRRSRRSLGEPRRAAKQAEEEEARRSKEETDRKGRRRGRSEREEREAREGRGEGPCGITSPTRRRWLTTSSPSSPSSGRSCSRRRGAPLTVILYDCIGVICVKKHHFKKKPIPTDPQWKISSSQPISFSSSDWMISQIRHVTREPPILPGPTPSSEP